MFYINLEKPSNSLYLGFCMGAQLDPNNEFLEDIGNHIRKMEITQVSKLENPDIRALLMAALELET